MGIFDIFSTQPAQNAAQAQIGGLNAGYNVASGDINQAIQALQGNYGNAAGSYTSALQPFLQNFGQAQQGTTQLGNALGLNGGAAGAGAAAAAYASNPAYQFQLQQGDQNVLRNAAQTGTTASGATLNALQQQGQGLANSTYQQYVQNLQPYLGASQNAASGIGGTYAGLAGTQTGLGNATAGQYGNLANLGFATQTGIGNANANADLSAYNASSNILGALGGFLGGGAKAGASAAGSALGGASAASSAGAGIGSALSSLVGLFSDFNLKEDVEKVGELYDGLGVYRYRYKGDDVPRIGLIAQEVEQTNPDAVGEVAGFKTVDYGRATQYASKLAGFAREEQDADNVVELRSRD